MVQSVGSPPMAAKMAYSTSQCLCIDRSFQLEVHMRDDLETTPTHDTMLDGTLLYDVILSGAGNVILNERLLNRINVFPVPDGDTGTNLALTLRTVMAKAVREPAVSRTMASISSRGPARLTSSFSVWSAARPPRPDRLPGCGRPDSFSYAVPARAARWRRGRPKLPAAG